MGRPPSPETLGPWPLSVISRPAPSTAATSTCRRTRARSSSSSTPPPSAASRPVRRAAAAPRHYGDRGFTVLGFPCDQFGNQEPGDETEIAYVLRAQLRRELPDVRQGRRQRRRRAPALRLARAEKSGLLGGRIKWNFTKFLVGRDGQVIKRFSPTTEPAQIAAARSRRRWPPQSRTSPGTRTPAPGRGHEVEVLLGLPDVLRDERARRDRRPGPRRGRRRGRLTRAADPMPWPS